MIPANISLDEDVLKRSLLFVFRRRLQDVFKMSWSRRTYSLYSYVFKTSSRCLDQDQYIRLGHTSSRRLQDVLPRCLQNVFKTSSRHLQDVLQRFLQDAFKTYNQVILILLTRFQDVFKTYSQRFWGVLPR